MTNTQLVNKLLDQMAGPWGRAAGTSYKYRAGYKVFLAWLDRPLVACSTHDLELFLARRPCAPATTAWELAILQTLFRFLHEHLGVIGSNPSKVLVKPKINNEQPKPVPDDMSWDRYQTHVNRRNKAAHAGVDEDGEPMTKDKADDSIEVVSLFLEHVKQVLVDNDLGDVA